MKTNLGIPNISLLSFMKNQDHSASKSFNGEFKLLKMAAFYRQVETSGVSVLL